MEGLDHKGPFSARWCWTRKHESRPWNEYAFFRKAVSLTAEPRRAIARISADARYTLFVNGRRVHHGPARSFPQHRSYDTIDLAPYLEVGPNSICAIVHQFGVPTFFSQYRDISGFLLDGLVESGEEAIDLHTPHGWLARQARGWRKDTARLSVQMGFQEHFDADADPPNWMHPTYAATAEDGWAEPWVAGPVGCHPWLAMESRGMPLLTDAVEDFKEVVAQFKGESGRGYKITPDICRLIGQESRKKERDLVKNVPAMLKDDAEPSLVAPPTDGEFVMAVLDLGIYRTGHILLDIAEAAGDEIVDVIFSEAIEKTGAPALRCNTNEPGACEEAPGFRYRCRPGAQRWESFQYLGLRYATLIFRNITKPLKLRHVALRQVHAGLEEAGAFECSDERLNAIWRVAKRTQFNCSFDGFVDCPGREQAQWWGDARVQSKVAAYAFGDYSMLARGIRQMAQSQAVDGSLHAHPPADIPGHRLPDFMMTWVGSLWDHAFYTGSLNLVRECLPAMHRLFDFFRRHESESRLLDGFDGFWIFLDWAEVSKCAFSATLNLMYLQAMRWATSLCEKLGDANAERYRAAAAALEGSIDTHFWDAAAQAWRDGFDPGKNEPVATLSQHANALAILLDLHPEAHPKIARDVLLKAALSRRSKIATASPFFYAFVIEAMIRAGLRDAAIDLIREKWGTFLDQGATTFWEYWEPSGSLCHAWSASPLYHISEQILGVTPTEAGWRQVRITPHLGKLEFARGVVPSPLGPIRVEWEKGGEDQLAVRIDVPPGMQVEFCGPNGERRALGAGAHEFQT